MAYILNIDTATDICSVAVANGDTVLAYRENGDGKTHAKTLLPFIEEALMEIKLTPADLQAVAVSMGPGSYTGLRIGTSTAKGLCYSLGIPLIAVPTLQIMAAGAAKRHPAAQLFVPLMDARRMEVFTCQYDIQLQALCDVSAVVVENETFAEIINDREIVFCGNGVDKCAQLLPNHTNIILDKAPLSARDMSVISYAKYQQQQFEDIAYFEPFYLKEYIAAKPHVKGLQ